MKGRIAGFAVQRPLDELGQTLSYIGGRRGVLWARNGNIVVEWAEIVDLWDETFEARS